VPRPDDGAAPFHRGPARHGRAGGRAGQPARRHRRSSATGCAPGPRLRRV